MIEQTSITVTAEEIQQRKLSDVGYFLLTDEQILQEILAEKQGIVIHSQRQTARVKRGESIAWEEFYASHNFNLDFSGLSIPEKRDGFDRLIIVAVSPQQAFEMCQKHFECWKVWDKSLDEIITDKPERQLPYALWLRGREEADVELKNTSANQLRQRGINGITLTARLIYEDKYFLEQKGQQRRHLDYKNGTLCEGSRRSDGRVPCVRWASDNLGVHWYADYGYFRVREGLGVDWYGPDSDYHGYFRVREAVY